MIFGFFEKKGCVICGKEARLGNNKLTDGANVCDDCVRPRSPHMDRVKSFNLEQIKQHLQEREANKAKLAAFSPTRVVGNTVKVYIDDTKGQWLITKSNRYKEENADIFDFRQLVGCNIKVDEDRREIKEKMEDGSYRSFEPPQYEYEYDIEVCVNVNSPWFSEMTFQVNPNRIAGRYSYEYESAERDAQEIKQALQELNSQTRVAVAEANKIPTSMVCPHCHATTTPDARGRCEYCGGAVG